MITWIAAAVLSGAPVATEDVAATWVYDDANSRIQLTLTPDGHCTIETRRRFNGTTSRTACDYKLSGSTVRVTAPGEGGKPADMVFTFDRGADEMRMADDGVKFYRTRLDRR